MENPVLEDVILSNLVRSEHYTRDVLPYLKEDYFEDTHHRTIFSLISKYFEKYNTTPSFKVLEIELDDVEVDQDTFNQCVHSLKEYGSSDVPVNDQWLYDETEKFCQDRAIYLAIMESIQIVQGKSKKDKGALTDILKDALAVSFDTNIGHDFLEDGDDRYEFYTKHEKKLPFGLDYFDKITRGGVLRKTLNAIIAVTGVGKTTMMIHFAGHHLMLGHNVLYITLEMAEEKIAERIDANLMGIPITDFETIDRGMYNTRLNRLKSKTQGKLIIKEYPPTTVGSGHFRHLLHELKTKKNFIPDVIYVDYLNLCTSSRVRMGGSINSYTYVKSVAEELRGLAVEFDVPIITATQANRDGNNNSDMDMGNTSESFGLPMTLDLFLAAISTEELEDLGQIMIKQLKNRYGDVNKYRKFMIGIDRPRMKLYNVEQNAQNLSGSGKDDDIPVMDHSSFGEGLRSERYDKSVFDEWKA